MYAECCLKNRPQIARLFNFVKNLPQFVRLQIRVTVVHHADWSIINAKLSAVLRIPKFVNGPGSV